MPTKKAAETTGIQIARDNFSLWVVGWNDDEVVDSGGEVVVFTVDTVGITVCSTECQINIEIIIS